MRISDWSSDVCSADLVDLVAGGGGVVGRPLGDQRKDERCASAGNVGGDLVADVGRCVCTRSVGFAGLRLVARRPASGDEQQSGPRGRGGAAAGAVPVGSGGVGPGAGVGSAHDMMFFFPLNTRFLGEGTLGAQGLK